MLSTTTCGEDLCHHKQVAISIPSMWMQIGFFARKVLKTQAEGQKVRWKLKLDLVEQQAESYARLSSCSSLKSAGKKLSSKIGFVHKGELPQSPPPLMPSRLSSSVIMKSLEEKKQKAIGPNWQDGATPSSHSTKFAPL